MSVVLLIIYGVFAIVGVGGGIYSYTDAKLCGAEVRGPGISFQGQGPKAHDCRDVTTVRGGT